MLGNLSRIRFRIRQRLLRTRNGSRHRGGTRAPRLEFLEDRRLLSTTTFDPIYQGHSTSTGWTFATPEPVVGFEDNIYPLNDVNHRAFAWFDIDSTVADGVAYDARIRFTGPTASNWPDKLISIAVYDMSSMTSQQFKDLNNRYTALGNAPTYHDAAYPQNSSSYSIALTHYIQDELFERAFADGEDIGFALLAGPEGRDSTLGNDSNDVVISKISLQVDYAPKPTPSSPSNGTDFLVGTNTRVEWTCDENTNKVNYRVQYSTDANFNSVNFSYITDGKFHETDRISQYESNAGRWYWRVEARLVDFDTSNASQSNPQHTSEWSTVRYFDIVKDTTPPTPNPSTWSTVPYATGTKSIQMVATSASDPSGVEYYFHETSGNPGGSDSGWQNSATYEDTGLAAGTTYTYVVKTRDKSSNGNEGTYSSSRSATTEVPDDTTPPTPNPSTWSTDPYSLGTSSIRMVASTASDPNGVEYYFDETSGNPGGSDSGWQASSTYEDTGLSADTTYTYRVKTRDKSANRNEGGYSISRSATTGTPQDTTPPTPNPSTWSTSPNATGPASIQMVATAASDPSGVEYYFDETSGNPGGSDSGWQDSATYEDTGLAAGTTYTYRIKTRDKSANRNEGNYSMSQSATTGTSQDTTPPTPNPSTWSTLPNASGPTSIQMVATAASDLSGVEYYFDETSGNPGGSDSGWQDSRTYEDTGLAAGMTYTYRVKARDKSAGRNETGLSSTQSATTSAQQDSIAPTPNPSGWDTPRYEWNEGPYASSANSIVMRALTTTDAGGSVEYFFDEITGRPGGSDSGWQSSPVYEDTGLSPGTTYSYRVKARDSSGNETDWSSTASETTRNEWYLCLGANCLGPYTYNTALDVYYSYAEAYSGYYNGVTGECDGRGCYSAEQSQMSPPVWHLWYRGNEYGPFSYDLAVKYYVDYNCEGWRNSATGESGRDGFVPKQWHLILGDGNENGTVNVGPFAYDTVLDLYYRHQSDVRGWYNWQTGLCDGAGCNYTGLAAEAERSESRTSGFQANAWRNPFNKYDIDGDGIVVPRDVLLVINELNKRTLSDPQTGRLAASQAIGSGGWLLVDVNGDGHATPRDVLELINHINMAVLSTRRDGAAGSPFPLPVTPLSGIPAAWAAWLGDTAGEDPLVPAQVNGEPRVFPDSPAVSRADRLALPVAVPTPRGTRRSDDSAILADLDSVLGEIAPDILSAWQED